MSRNFPRWTNRRIESFERRPEGVPSDPIYGKHSISIGMDLGGQDVTVSRVSKADASDALSYIHSSMVERLQKQIAESFFMPDEMILPKWNSRHFDRVAVPFKSLPTPGHCCGVKLVKYVGFTQSFNFCPKCDSKEYVIA